MNGTLRQVICGAGIFALALSTGACGTLWHSAKRIHGQVVDAETGKPLQGVIVVAQWVPYHYGIAHAGGHRGSIHSYEAVTDKEGNYLIPAWGPRSMPPFSTIKSADPNLMFFKGGYVPFSAANTVREFGIAGHPNQHETPLGVSEWDGEVIKLKRFRGGDKEYAERMRTFSSGFQTEFGEWREFPLMIWAVEREDRRLKRVLADDNSIYLPSRIVDMRTLKPEDVEYLRGYESTE